MQPIQLRVLGSHACVRRHCCPSPKFRVEKVAAPLRHGVTESIRYAIALGRFKAGERLSERALCEMTGVSRTLVREALRQLESEGLITVLPHRGGWWRR